jgi:hypothetical protein
LIVLFFVLVAGAGYFVTGMERTLTSMFDSTTFFATSILLVH